MLPSASRSTSSRASSNGSSKYPPRSSAPHALLPPAPVLSSSLAPMPLLAGEGPSAPGYYKRTVNSECMASMDMISELFQQQAKRLEAQLFQQLRDQAEIEHTQSQLAAASQQLKRLQVQNMELRRLVDANEMNIRAMYGHARSLQVSQNDMVRVCESLADDAALLRQALREECPDRAHEFAEVSRPTLPARLRQLPPIEELLPPPGPSSAGVSGASNGPNMETALALLSTVATSADTSATQPDHHGDNGGSDAGSAEEGSTGGSTGSNQGSNGSNQGSLNSSNQGTDDTVLVHSNGESNGNGSSHSKESPDEADSGDGVGSSHGSDSGDGSNAHAESNGGTESTGDSRGGCKHGGKGSSSNGDSDSNGDSNGDSLPIGDGSAGTSASRSGSDASSPPHELDAEPPQNSIASTGTKRKR